MKKIYGVGVNDMVGKSRMPIYHTWVHMLQRCCDPKTQAKYPTYKGCTVCDEWLRLSNFWKWAEKCWKASLHLDKDIIQPGNKIYCPEFCCFVTQALNLLLNDYGNARGKWPRGVCFHQGKFTAQCRVNGKYKFLGRFNTPEEAHKVYVQFKVKHILEIAKNQPERIAQGLRKHARNLFGAERK